VRVGGRTSVHGKRPDAGRRRRTLERLTAAISDARRPGHVVRVGIDGVDGAGKTVFADELADILQSRGTTVLRASVDGFHHPPPIRHRRGRDSPEGFFLDSYDDDALHRLLLEPLAGSGDRQVVLRAYDVQAETPVDVVVLDAADVQVLVFDGIFLHRPELREVWDLSGFLEVEVEVSIPRGAGRGYGDPDPSAASNRRYVEGQRLYMDACQPRDHAS
jgi:uridine kinase